MREGLWSFDPVPGAGIFSSVEEYSEARQGVGNACVGVARIPLHVRPASNSSSAVKPLRSTAGWPFKVVDVSGQALFGLFESGLKQGADPATSPLSKRQLKPIHGLLWKGN